MNPIKNELTMLPALSEEDKKLLSEKSVLILGLGGLGGYLCEFSARLGIGHLTVVDGDVFDASNLNRQLYCSPSSLGNSKAKETEKRIHEFFPGTAVTAVNAFFGPDNARELMKGQDLVLDGLDNLPSRLLAADTASACGIPFVHGGLDGWYLQVASVMPGTTLLHQIYKNVDTSRKPNPTLSFVPAICAGLEVCEAVKLLLGKKSDLENRLLFADLSTLKPEILDFNA